MLSNRDEKTEAPSMRSLAIDLLKDVIDESKINEFIENTDENISDICEQINYSDEIPEDIFNKFLSKASRISFYDDADYIKEIVFTNEPVSEEEISTTFAAAKNRAVILYQIKMVIDKMLESISQYQTKEMITKEQLFLILTDFFKDKLTNENEQAEFIDAVINEYITKYLETFIDNTEEIIYGKNSLENKIREEYEYYSFKESILIFTCEKVLRSQSHSNTIDLLSVHQDLDKILEKHKVDIGKKYSEIQQKLNAALLKIIFRKTKVAINLDLVNQIDDIITGKKSQSKLDNILISMFKVLFKLTIYDIINMKEALNQSIKDAHNSNEQEALLYFLKERKNSIKITNDLLNNAIDRFLKSSVTPSDTSIDIDLELTKAKILTAVNEDISRSALAYEQETADKLQNHKVSRHFFSKDMTLEQKPDDKSATSSLRIG